MHLILEDAALEPRLACPPMTAAHTRHGKACEMGCRHAMACTIRLVIEKTCSPHLRRLEQAEADLHAAPLPVRHAVHAPAGVDVQHAHELGPALGVHARYALYHLQRRYVPLPHQQRPSCQSEGPII